MNHYGVHRNERRERSWCRCIAIAERRDLAQPRGRGGGARSGVIGGDAVTGPMNAETLDALMALEDRALFVRGNAHRWKLRSMTTRSPQRRTMRIRASAPRRGRRGISGGIIATSWLHSRPRWSWTGTGWPDLDEFLKERLRTGGRHRSVTPHATRSAAETPRYRVFPAVVIRRLSMCWSKYEREQWERERREREKEREAERLRWLSATQPERDEPEPELETEEPDRELVRG
jgi:hypothetical protein